MSFSDISIFPSSFGFLDPAIIPELATVKFKYLLSSSTTNLAKEVTLEAKIVFNLPVRDISEPITSSLLFSLIYLSAICDA